MSKRVCPKCNYETENEVKFCEKCGSKLTIVEEIKEEVKEKKETNAKDSKKLIPGIDFIPYQKKKKTGKIIAIIIIVLLLIAAIVTTIILLSNKSNKTSEEKEIVDNNEKEQKPEKAEEYKYISVYYEYSKGFSFNENNGEFIAQIPVKSNDYKILDGRQLYNNTYDLIGGIILYADDGVVTIYNSSGDYTHDPSRIKKLKLNSNYEKYEIITETIYDDDGSSYIKERGIEYQDGIHKEKDEYGYDRVSNIDKTGYYSLDLDKVLYANMGYHGFYFVNDDTIGAIKGYESENLATAYLLNSKREETLLQKLYETDGCSTYKYVSYGYHVLAGYTDCMEGYIVDADLYNANMNLIKSNINGNNVSVYKNRLYYFDENTVSYYNPYGSTPEYTEEYEKVLDVILNYFLIVEDGKLIITNEDDMWEEIGDWKDTYYYHSMLSGYYNEGQLANENEKESGIYLIIETDENGPSSGVEYYFNPLTLELKKYDLPEIGGYAKPVLYLYPKEDTNVTVTFKNKENITVSYPKFNDNWNVLAKPNGDLYDENGKYYYGLYWEEKLNHYVDFKTGFYVDKENAIEFLEEKLSIIGLNDREKNEFIMYWLPILEKNGKNLVYFELTEERDNYSQLIINPEPDSILRLAIHVKKIDEYHEIEEEILPTFKRDGFTAVEWGGVIYK